LTDAAFAPDGKTIITGSRDGTVRLWPVRASRGNESRAYTERAQTFFGGTGMALCPSPDGLNLLVVYIDDTFSICDTVALTASRGQSVRVGVLHTGALASGAKPAAFGGKGGKVILWHADSATREQFSWPETGVPPRGLGSPDGRQLAIGGAVSRDNTHTYR